MEVFKIQLPLAYSGPKEALVYNEDRSAEGVLPAEAVKDIMAGRPKAFFNGEVNAEGELEIYSEAPWQDW